MICPECNGKGEVKYYRETDRDECSVTVKGFVDVCHTCHGSGKKTQTNADHIRSMTDKEMANYLVLTALQQCPCPTKDCEAFCNDCLLHWLKQPYKEDT